MLHVRTKESAFKRDVHRDKYGFAYTSHRGFTRTTNAGTIVPEQVRDRGKCTKHEQWIFQLRKDWIANVKLGY